MGYTSIKTTTKGDTPNKIYYILSLLVLVKRKTMKDTIESTSNFWSDFATDFEKNNEKVVGYKNQRMVIQWLQHQKNLGITLELGSGDGAYTNHLRHEATRYHATDLSNEMREQLKRRFTNDPKVVVEEANCFGTPYPDNTFDTVVMANLYHIIPSHTEALKEIYRILKPNGKLIIVSYTNYGMSFLSKMGLAYRYLKQYKKKAPYSRTLIPSIVEKELTAFQFNNSKLQLIGESTKALCVETFKIP